jgi:hypothetical protein
MRHGCNNGVEKMEIDLYEGFRMVKPKKSPGTWDQREYEATGELNPENRERNVYGL